MIKYIMEILASKPINIIASAVMIVCVSALMFVSYYYANRRNIRWFTYIEFFSVVLMFALSLLPIDNYNTYLLLYLILLIVVNVALFAHEIGRDLFRRAWIANSNNSKNASVSDISIQSLENTSKAIVAACQNMSKADIGALILIADEISETILDSGTKMGAIVTSELLETLFWPKTPLHDGAVVITANKLVSAGCYLPLTANIDLPRELGTRHRAAIGVTDLSPAITAIVVSEESGIISAFRDGKVKRYLDADGLGAVLGLALHILPQDQEDKIWGGK